MSNDLVAIQELIDSAMSSLKTAQNLLRGATGISDTSHERLTAKASSLGMGAYNAANVKVVEGVFDGQNMVDASGQSYPIPANYASKSKLVEGDGMKLSITEDGKFIYKQISPIDRKTVIGVLIQEDGQYKILAEGKTYRVLLASVTFYRAQVGDQVTVLIPKSSAANWGAIDAVIPRQISDASAKAALGIDLQATATPAPAAKKSSRKKIVDDGELLPEVE